MDSTLTLTLTLALTLILTRHEPVTSFFNATALAAYVPVVSFPAFARASRRRIDRLWRLTPP